MEINIYARWEGQRQAGRNHQRLMSGSPFHGHTCYLTKFHLGEPHALPYLFAEAFVTGQAEIAAAACDNVYRPHFSLP